MEILPETHYEPLFEISDLKLWKSFLQVENIQSMIMPKTLSVVILENKIFEKKISNINHVRRSSILGKE